MMRTGIVHPNIFTGHATADLSLPFVFQFSGAERNWVCSIRKQTVFSGHFAEIQVINQVLVVRKNMLRQFSIDATVVFNAVFFQIDLFGTGCQRYVPAFGLPPFADFYRSFGNFNHLFFCKFRIFNISF